MNFTPNFQFFAPAALIGIASEYFRSNSSKFRQKINKMLIFFIKNTKIFSCDFGARNFVFLES